MSEGFKPMLASNADISALKFPLLASAKLDGVRAIVRDGVVYSRANKPIPNTHVQRAFSRFAYFDGELIVGEPTSKTCYRDTVSYVMTHGGDDGDLRFYTFDYVQSPHDEYINRIAHLVGGRGVFVHEQHVVTNVDELLTLENDVLCAGHEGLILRKHNAPYKYGRSTVKEGYLLKLKRFVDAEFEVVGFEERMHNGNEAVVNELGRTKRSSHQVNKTGHGDLGALVVRDTQGRVFNVGTGFDAQQRVEVWNNQAKYLGKAAKVKYFAVGMKDAPRHPVFLGWRQGD